MIIPVVEGQLLTPLGWLIRNRPMVDITMEKEHVEYQNIQRNDIPNIDIDMEVLIIDYAFQISENIGIITMEKGKCRVFTSCFSHVLLHELKRIPVSCICLLVTSGVGGSLQFFLEHIFFLLEYQWFLLIINSLFQLRKEKYLKKPCV